MNHSHSPADNVVFVANTYPLDSDLSAGSRYPAFNQLGPETNAPRSEYTMRYQDKCCRSLQWITREKESFLSVSVETTTKNPIVPSFSLFRCIFCCFQVSKIMAMPNPHPRSGFGKVRRIKRWKCFGIAPWIYPNNFEKVFATDGAVVRDQRTKKLLIPKVTNKQTNKQTNNENKNDNRRQTYHIVQRILPTRKTPLSNLVPRVFSLVNMTRSLSLCGGERGWFFLNDLYFYS